VAKVVQAETILDVIPIHGGLVRLLHAPDRRLNVVLSLSGDRAPTSAEKDAARDAAHETGERFSNLYTDGSQKDKARLQESMKAIADAYAMLRLQWSALGQSHDYGVAVLAKVKARYPEVPFVFSSSSESPLEKAAERGSRAEFFLGSLPVRSETAGKTRQEGKNISLLQYSRNELRRGLFACYGRWRSPSCQ
jgi:hypothetical protein